jgi:HK97 family phage major capsid protein
MSVDLLKRLHEQRMAAVKAAREIAERMSTSEATSAEDEAAYAKANEDVSRFGALAQDERKRLDAESENAEAFADAEARAGVKHDREGGKEGRKLDWQDEARAAIKAGERKQGGTFESLPSPQRVAELRALTDPFQKTSATHGQETVPTTLVESLFLKLFTDSAVLSAGPTILRTGSGEALKFPRLTSLGALTQANARVAELGTIQKGNATFDQVQLDAYKYGQISQSGREVIEDSVLDMRSLMGTILGRNMANYLGYDLTLGTGTNQPRGVVTVAAASGQTVTSATSVAGKPTTMDNILDVIAKLPVPYRRGAKWLMNDVTTFVLRKFKLNFSTGDNAYAWQPSVVPGGPDTLMGYPIAIDPNVANTGVNNVSIIFGDFSMYYVRLVNDVRVEYSTEYAWDTDLVSVKAVLRADGDAIDDTAFAAFVGAAT